MRYISDADRAYAARNTETKDEKLARAARYAAMVSGEEAAVTPTVPAPTQAQTPPALTQTQNQRKYRSCPRCGATSGEANFTTRPPYCDDCA